MQGRRVERAALFYEFSLDRHVPADHMFRSIGRFVDLEDLRAKLAAYYGPIGPTLDRSGVGLDTSPRHTASGRR